MGDRALVIFHDSDRISPAVYLHRHGGRVPEILRDLAGYMQGRYGDAEYAAARFTGICHQRIDGNLSLGIISNTLRHADLDDPAGLAAPSHGDAGVVVVDTGDFTWRAHGGYLTGRPPRPWSNPQTPTNERSHLMKHKVNIREFIEDNAADVRAEADPGSIRLLDSDETTSE